MFCQKNDTNEINYNCLPPYINIEAYNRSIHDLILIF